MRCEAYMGERQRNAKTPSPRVAPGTGDPLRTQKVLGVNLRLMLADEGLSSFGPNPTANPAGVQKEVSRVPEGGSCRTRPCRCRRVSGGVVPRSEASPKATTGRLKRWL